MHDTEVAQLAAVVDEHRSGQRRPDHAQGQPADHEEVHTAAYTGPRGDQDLGRCPVSGSRDEMAAAPASGTRSVVRMLARVSYVVYYLLAAAIGLVFVFLSELQDDFGLSGTEVGVVASTGFLAALVSQLLLSPLVDRGHIEAIAWFAVAIGAAGSIGFGLSDDVVTFALSRGAVGIGLGLYGIVARKAIIGADVTGGGAKVGALLSSVVAGFISGPAIGAALGSISFATPFVVVGMALVVPGAIGARLIGQAEIAAAPVGYGDLGALLRRPRVQAALLTQFVVFGFIGIFDSTVDRYLTDVGVSDTGIALALVVVGAPMLFLPPRTGALAERSGGARVVVPAIALTVPVIVVYGFLNGVYMFIAIGLVHTTCEAFSNMGAQVLVLEAAGAERAAVGSALLDAVGMAIAAVTAFVGPPLYLGIGEAALFGGFAVISAVCLAVMVWRLRAVKAPSLLHAIAEPV